VVGQFLKKQKMAAVWVESDNGLTYYSAGNKPYWLREANTQNHSYKPSSNDKTVCTGVKLNE
jgi:hypothetical protein